MVADFEGVIEHPRDPTEAEMFLALLRAEPDLLDRAPFPCAAAADRRAREETHMCLHCGALAERVLLVMHVTGQRWLDLCADCHAWLKAAQPPPPLVPPPPPLPKG